MAESDRRYTRAIVLHQHGVHENACRIAAWSSRCLPESHPSSIGAETIMRSSSSKTHTFPLRRRSRRSRIRSAPRERGRGEGAGSCVSVTGYIRSHGEFRRLAWPPADSHRSAAPGTANCIKHNKPGAHRQLCCDRR
jgi:hypothetical protein